MTALPPSAQALLDLPTGAFLEAVSSWSAQEVDDAMWMRCREDRALFCAAFFPDRFPAPFNLMHRDFLSRPKVCWTERKSKRQEADAAPRGGAKSTLRSYAELLHDVVYGLEAYVAVISTTYDLAEDLVKDPTPHLHQPGDLPRLPRCLWALRRERHTDGLRRAGSGSAVDGHPAQGVQLRWHHPRHEVQRHPPHQGSAR